MFLQLGASCCPSRMGNIQSQAGAAFMKERPANNLNFPPLTPVTMLLELQCESGFVQREPKNRYKLNDFEVSHGSFD